MSTWATCDERHRYEAVWPACPICASGGTKRLALATPTYGAVEPEIRKHLEVAMMHAASTGAVQWIGDISTIRVGWVGARNAMAKAAIQGRTLDGEPCDGVFWLDDDVKLASMDVISRLVSYPDFATGVVFQKEPPHMPLIALYENEERTGDAGFHWWSGIPERVLAPIDGAGFGCMYTSTNLLRKIAALPDFPTDGWFNQIPTPGKRTAAALKRGEPPPLFSEDFSFCLRARKAGIQLLVDTAILCEHYRGPRYATAEDFRREQELHPSETLGAAQMQGF